MYELSKKRQIALSLFFFVTVLFNSIPFLFYLAFLFFRRPVWARLFNFIVQIISTFILIAKPRRG